MEQYDVVVIGAGPGGYVAAIRCAQLGLKTAVVDQWVNPDGQASLGGTCLNVGCIPSKALLDSSEKFHQLQHGFHEHGIAMSGVSIDIAAMMARKDKIVATLTSGIETLFLKHKITWFKGTGRLFDNKTVEIISDDGGTTPETVTASHVIIATGSRPRQLDAAPFDENIVVDSTGALKFTEAPKRLVVIGGGVVGLELGSVWQRLGSQVTVLVRGEKLLRNVDDQIAQEAYTQLTAQGLDIQLGAVPIATETTNKTATVTYLQGGEEKILRANKVLVSAGREPYTDGLNAADAGLKLDAKGFIEVDGLCQTNVSGIYAIGDVTRGPMLAHKASEEGVSVAERIAGQSGHVNYETIPWVIYTHPEIAWVGPTSQELRAKGVEFRIGVFPFKGNGRAYAMGDVIGMVKLLSDAKSDRLLAAHIIGPNASEMIAEAVVAMEFNASAEDIARTVHAHPTLSEAFHEAALAVDKRTLHI